jgi:hypothetical protein
MATTMIGLSWTGRDWTGLYCTVRYGLHPRRDRFPRARGQENGSPQPSRGAAVQRCRGAEGSRQSIPCGLVESTDYPLYCPLYCVQRTCLDPAHRVHRPVLGGAADKPWVGESGPKRGKSSLELQRTVRSQAKILRPVLYFTYGRIRTKSCPEDRI